MADKTIGSLPLASALTDDSSFVCEDSGEAKRVTGKQIKDFAEKGATQAAEAAAKSAQQAAESAAVYDNVVTDVNQLKSDLTDLYIDYNGMKYVPETSISDDTINVTLRNVGKHFLDKAIGDVTYQDLFGESYNLLKTDFDTGSYSPAILNAGTPTITDEVYATKPYSLKAFGTTSQQIYEIINYPYGCYYIASMVRVDRYVKGYAGVLWGTSNIAGLQRATDGFEVVSSIFTLNGGTGSSVFIGTWSSADIDAYIDKPVIINITDLFYGLDTVDGRESAKRKMDELFFDYVSIINNSFEKSFAIDMAKPKYAGVVLDANSSADRFVAMKQLYDIANRTRTDPNYMPSVNEFTSATKGIVCELPSGSTAFYENYPLKVIFEKDADVQTLPASTTKIVSLVTAMPYITSVMEKVSLISSDIQAGSGNYFKAGDVMTVEDLMLGMMLPSSNTCAMAFAHHIGKKILENDSATYDDCISAFVAEMNRKAKLLGCTNSAFDTPSGLSRTNKTTANDLLRILIEACSHNEILRVWNKKSFDIVVGGTNERTVHLDTTVTDETLESSYYIFGGKTGSLDYGDGTKASALVMIAEPK